MSIPTTHYFRPWL